MNVHIKDYEGRPYLDGKDDCYGLVRKFYSKEYGLELSNYARPHGFTFAGIDLISENFIREGFKVVDVSLNRLEIGDGILMAITRSVLANHVGVYVGNNYMLHHLYQKDSNSENFDEHWKRRVLTIVRHPKVTEVNNSRPIEQVKLIDMLPPHVRAQFIT